MTKIPGWTLPLLIASIAPITQASSTIAPITLETIAARTESVQRALDTVTPAPLQLTVAVSVALHPDVVERLAEALARLDTHFADTVDVRLAVRGIDVGEIPESYYGLDRVAQLEWKRRLQAGIKRLGALTEPLGAQIDPAFFERFAIEAVPVFVLQDKAESCTSEGTPTWIVRGTVDVAVALQTMLDALDNNDKATHTARAALPRLIAHLQGTTP